MSQQSFDCIGESTYGDQDFVPTPMWATDALVASRHPPPRNLGLIDPFGGNGAILSRLADHGYSKERMHAVELRSEEHAGLVRQGFGSVHSADWFELRRAIVWHHMGVVTNVPWSILVEAVLSCLYGPRGGRVPYLASLQPLEELGGVGRSVWLNEHTPTALVSMRSRMFPHAARGCAWFIWKEGCQPLDLQVL